MPDNIPTVLAKPNVTNAVFFDIVPRMRGRHMEDISLTAPVIIEVDNGSKLVLVNSK